jgi:hypothetical protein
MARLDEAGYSLFRAREIRRDGTARNTGRPTVEAGAKGEIERKSEQADKAGN